MQSISILRSPLFELILGQRGTRTQAVAVSVFDCKSFDQMELNRKFYLVAVHGGAGYHHESTSKEVKHALRSYVIL